MIYEFHKPIPVITEHGEGYAIYVESGGQFENDIWTVCLCEGGLVRHYNTSQIRIYKNATFGIYEKKVSQKIKKTCRPNDTRKTRPNKKSLQKSKTSP